ncbi:MAG: type III pantothenate kinase [Bacteroidetes bacterium]|nr:MAG: type III pantothenate kinase [Bacteroidota bacterium]
MHNLVVDQGNTRLKYATFMRGKLQTQGVIDVPKAGDILALATNHAVQNIIFSTVSTTPTPEEAKALADAFRYYELSATTPLPIRNSYRTPDTLGKDRLAAVVGAYALYPGQTCLVIDAGTCMTLDVLTDTGEYLGGNISPGVRMRYRAMHQFTARLPLVAPGSWQLDWGVDTHTALENGGLLGAALEMEAWVARLRSQWPHLQTLLTGGDAALLAKRLKCKIFVHPNLVLYGLDKILTYNVKQLA